MTRIGICAVAVLALFAGSATAEIQNWEPVWIDDDVLDSTWTWDLVQTDTPAVWSVYEPFVDVGDLTFAGVGDVNLRGGGGTFGLEVDKEVFNDSSFAWTSYEIEISGSATFIGLTSFDQFVDVNVNTIAGVTTIVFSNGTVNSGETFNVGVELELPPGPFNFTVTQTAIPEPASFALLALGGLALIRRR